MSKGSWKRPVFVPHEKVGENYNRTFGKKPVPGETMMWNDPDGGAGSRTLVVAEAKRHGDFWKITDTDGGFLECPQAELS
jgi:hypothetical protein